MYGVWAASVVGSFQALYGLANGYGGWPQGVAFILPGTLDTYWLTALQVALNRDLKMKRRIAAAFHAVVAFLLSLAGNILYHELHAKQWQLGKSAPLVVATISSVPLLAAAAMTHLRSLMNSAPADAGSETGRGKADRGKRRRSRTAPTDRPKDRHAKTSQPPHATTPPSQATTPPPDGTTPGNRPSETTPPMRRGGRPDPEVLAAAERIWDEAFAVGKIHNRRTLQKAVNDHYGASVIGESACQSVVDERREGHRRTG